MKKNSSPSHQFLSRLICILITILFHLPAISLALDFRSSNHPNTSRLALTSKSNFAAKKSLSVMTAFSNTNPITVADATSPSTGVTVPGLGSPYPSGITVSGLSGTISDVNVTFNGFTSGRQRHIYLN